MAKEKEYAKLAGPGLLAYQRLYEAKDHFLVVEGVYQESYRRLFYKDIQALIYCPTKAGSITMLITALGLLASLLGVAVTMASQSPVLGMWVVFAIIFGVVLLFAVIAGGTCSLAIKTPAQIVPLRNVSGRRRARKLIRKVTEIVESVQGPLTQEVLDDAFVKARAANTPSGSQMHSEGAPPIL
ncbi:hypothetical protein [Rubellicoccus peritrichatus]|uniref:Uncharacterized protein n=1 Tax=Rubellicoccus peritrichatus TaxID=3080537 RepID=A0AAQ3QWS5_9BACT|nr:hypothetical protein [Puniceicoccus sp. CR14]WOO42182.1 hypothetical protein RZN69_03710 [Puniceicoccus sp. CR14]